MMFFSTSRITLENRASTHRGKFKVLCVICVGTSPPIRHIMYFDSQIHRIPIYTHLHQQKFRGI